MRYLSTICVALLALNATVTLLAGSGQIPEERVIAWLRSPEQRVREGAIDHVLKDIGPERRSQALDRALADELLRLNQLVRERNEADRSGAPLVDDFPAEYYASVIQAVSQSPNVLSIQPLAGALGTGRMVEEGLAKFGDRAVPDVLGVARLKVGLITTGAPGDTPPHVVAGALGALRLLVEQQGKPLRSESRKLIEGIARERLSRRQEAGVVAAACRLAIALSEPSLRQRVQQIAANRAEVLALGVSDTASVEFVQKVARNALEGK